MPAHGGVAAHRPGGGPPGPSDDVGTHGAARVRFAMAPTGLTAAADAHRAARPFQSSSAITASTMP